MRITPQSIQQTLLAGLRGRTRSVARATQQATSGRRIQTVSDAPVDASQVMRLESQARDLDQYRRNGTYATAKLSAEDSALSSLVKTLQDAKAIAMSTTASDPASPERQSAVAQLKALQSQAVALGNTKMGDEYVFGGAKTTTPPFQSDGTYVGDTTSPSVAINDGVTVTTGQAGQPLVSDAIDAINTLLTELQVGTPQSISGTVQDLESATQTALQGQAVIGATMKNIQTTSDTLAARSASLLDRRDQLQNVDPAEAIVNLQSEQSALERAYAVVGRVLQSTLTDYLK